MCLLFLCCRLAPGTATSNLFYEELMDSCMGCEPPVLSGYLCAQLAVVLVVDCLP